MDLDGAKDGYPVNSELIAEICLAVDIPVEVSGGIRTRTAIEDAFTCESISLTSLLLGPICRSENLPILIIKILVCKNS